MPPRRAITDVDKLFCTVDGCENIVKAKGLCTKHHQRWYRTGSTTLFKKNDPLPKCKTIDCENSGHNILGYCWVCWEKRKGDKNG
jgi:hypothetical protein